MSLRPVIPTDDESLPPEDRVIGQRCGGSYTIVSLLGRGGMGAVYLATSEKLAGKPAAVKVLAPELTQRSEGVARFRAEVYAAGKIDDPNIVQVFDTGELVGGRLYMMMEYCSSGSLAALLEKRGPLPFDLILAIACPIGSALHAAHTQARITHRDIKPANILLLQEPGGPLRAKLADFGIAKLHDDQIAVGMRTGTQKILGSPGYMAPEQCIGQGGVDSRADVYAFGSVLYQMVTGQRPYAGESVFELITNVVSNTPFPRPGQLRRDLPSGWDDVIMGCLAHRREDRIQTIKQVVQRLAQAVATGPSLMSYMAPRLVDDQIAPTAITISDGIGAAVTQWADARLAARERGGRARVRLLATLLCGVVVGSGATALVAYGAGNRSAAPQVASVASERSAAVAPGAKGVPRIAGEPRQASLLLPGEGPPMPQVPRDPDRVPAAPPQLDASVDRPPIATRVDVGVARPTVPTHAAVLAGSAAPTPDDGSTPRRTEVAAAAGVAQRRNESSAAVAAGSDPDRPSHTMEKSPAQAPVEQGALRVEVDPWADVTISGEKDAYTTPVTIRLAAGHHRVVLTRGAHKETIDVNITPHETIRISRSW